ncbi:MAG TPA: tyrosine-type recombinase/integrase [Mycobacteriales bacterium]|nr:tyrosine-type recombinase/integrase [Mycobacteriales bacterium]
MTAALAVREPLVLAVPPSDVDRLVAAWLLAYSNARTREAYAADLAQFRRWLGDVAPDAELIAVRRPHLDTWARSLETSGLAPSSVGRKLAAVSSFFTYCVSVEVLTANPATYVRRPKVSTEGKTPGLSREEAARLLALAADAPPMDDLLVALLFVNGLRVSEACGLDVESITSESGHCVAWVKGKGGSEHRVPLPPRVCSALARVLDGRDDRTGPLLVWSRTGARLDRHQAARRVKALARKAGIDGVSVSPHVGRTTAITAALDAGVPLRDAVTFARHADPRMTLRYDRGAGVLDRHGAYAVAAHLAGAPSKRRKGAEVA